MHDFGTNHYLVDFYSKPEIFADMLSGRVLIELENEYRRIAPKGADVEGRSYLFVEFLAVFLNILDYPD